MWPAKSPQQKTTFKQILEIVQSLVTIGAIVVGGWWAYMKFALERGAFPNLNIEHRISHIELSRELTLVHVKLDVSNGSVWGGPTAVLGRSIVRIQQVLPLVPCAGQIGCESDEIADNSIERKSDTYNWPLMKERVGDELQRMRIGPGEKGYLEFDFVIPSNVKVVRVYTWTSNPGDEIGWAMSSYYDFRKPGKGEISSMSSR